MNTTGKRARKGGGNRAALKRSKMHRRARRLGVTRADRERERKADPLGIVKALVGATNG